MMVCDPLEVLDALKPCNNIKVLQVTQYPGNEFPVWITEYSVLKNLIELYIIGCKKCTKIPPLDKLPYLQILYLKFFDKLRHLCSSDSTSGERDEEVQLAFPALEKLVLFEMPILSRWCEGEAGNETSLNFPVLKSLDIIDYPELTAMPSAPLLEKLSIKGNRTLQCIATGLTKIQTLSLERHGGDTESENESFYFQPWESLQRLELSGYNRIVPIHTNEVGKPNVTPTKCRSLRLTSFNVFLSDGVQSSLFWFWNCFMFLELLMIEEAVNLIYWPEKEFRSLNCLVNINLCSCPNFLGSQQESAERSIAEALLPKLKFMWIDNCPGMIEIPKCSTTIQKLEISDCTKLERLPGWLGSMVSLKELDIKFCENLQSLPSSIGGLKSLQKLEIGYCENFANLLKEWKG